MLDYPTFDFDQVDFVTSDTHFSHARISELAGRPYSTVEEMNEDLVCRWNDTVSPGAVVLHLGDVALGSIEESIALTARLNGRRLLVPGNHDRVSPATQSKRAIERFLPMYEATTSGRSSQRSSRAPAAGTGSSLRTTPTPATARNRIDTRRIARAGTTESRSSTGTPTRGTMARMGISSTSASTPTTSHQSRSASSTRGSRGCPESRRGCRQRSARLERSSPTWTARPHSTWT
ncbi:metallophosphoesterase [Microbacterium sp. NPDC076768]|uniref:metallophosphoesterase n=1 Tax=Microbacterium sp. NPDC076768 TaxID=3154858 RepID=UPI003421A6C3